MNQSKRNLNQMETKEVKQRYKMYKANGRWVVAPLVFISLGLASVNVAQADSITNNDGTSAEQVSLTPPSDQSATPTTTDNENNSVANDESGVSSNNEQPLVTNNDPLNQGDNGGSVANIQVLSNIKTTVSSPNDNGDTVDNPLTGNDATFIINGDGVADVNLLKGADKSGVLTIPNELKGKVKPNGDAVGEVSFLLPVDALTVLEPVTNLLNEVVTGTGLALDKLIGNEDKSLLGKLTGLLTNGGLVASINGIDDLTNDLNLLKGTASDVDPNSKVIEINNGKIKVPVKLEEDINGNQYLVANLNQAIGSIATDKLSSILNNVITDLNNIQISVKANPGALMDAINSNKGSIPLLGPLLGGVTGALGSVLGGTVSTLGGLLNVLGVNNLLKALGIGDELHPVLDKNGLNLTIPSIKNNLINSVNTLLNGDNGILKNSGKLLNQILGAAILNSSKIELPVTLDKTGLEGNLLNGNVYGGNFNGSIAENNLLDVSLLNNKIAPTMLYVKVDDNATTAPSAQVTNPTKDNGYKTTVSGEAIPGATVTVTDGEGNKLAEGKAGDDGKFSVDVPGGKNGQDLKVTATEDGKKPSEPVTVTVGEANKDALNEAIKNGDALKNSAVYNNASPAQQTALDDALAEANKQDQDLNAQQQPVDSATDALNKAIDGISNNDASHVKVPTDKTPVDDPSHLSDGEKAQVKDNVEKSNPDSTATVDDNGDTQVTFPDGSHTTMPGGDLTAAKETTATPFIDGVDNPTDTNNYTPTVNGQATPGATVMVTDGEGNKLAEGKAGDDGKFSIDVPGAKNGQDLKVTATEDGKKPSAAVDVKIPNANKTALESAINQVNGVKDSDAYKNASPAQQTALEDALAEANKQDQDSNAQQQPVDSAADELNKVIDGINHNDASHVKVPTDKTPVDDPDHLSDGEKAQVKDNVEKANPDSTATVDDNGDAQVTFPDGSQTTIPGGDLTTPKETTATPVIDGVDNPTTANNYTPAVNGHVTPGATVTVTDGEGNKLAEGKAGDDGKFSVDVPGDKNGQGLKVTATEDGKKPSEPVTVTVGEANKDALNEAIKNGGALKNSAVYNNASPAQQTALDDALSEANKQIQDPNAQQQPVDDVTKALNDAIAGINNNDASDVKVPTDTLLVDDLYYLSDDEKAQVKDNVEKANPGVTATVDDNGDTQVTFPDGSHTTIPGGDLTTPKATTTAPSAQVTSLTNNSGYKTTVSGETKPGATITVKDNNGKIIGTTTVGNDGNYSVDVPAGNGDKLTVTAQEPNKKPSEPFTVTVSDANKDALKDAIKNGDDLKNTDAYKNASDAQKDALDKTLSEANKQNQDPNAQQQPVDSATDALNKAIDGIKNNDASGVKVPTDKTPVDDPSHLSDGEKDQVKDDVQKANPDSTETVDDNGDTQVTVPDGSHTTIPGGDLTTPTAVIDGVDNPTTANYYTPTVFGHAAPGATITVTDGNGNKVAEGKADNEGKFSIPVPGAKNGEDLKVTAQEPNKKPSTPVTVIVGNANKRDLQSAINRGKDLKNSDAYKNASDVQKDALDKVLAEADKQNQDQNAQQQPIDEVIANLQKAINEVEVNSVNNATTVADENRSIVISDSDTTAVETSPKDLLWDSSIPETEKTSISLTKYALDQPENAEKVTKAPQTLPQTSNEQNHMSGWGGVLLLMSGLLSIFGVGKKRHD